jgi:hypothetical protein
VTTTKSPSERFAAELGPLIERAMDEATYLPWREHAWEGISVTFQVDNGKGNGWIEGSVHSREMRAKLRDAEPD